MKINDTQAIWQQEERSSRQHTKMDKEKLRNEILMIPKHTISKEKFRVVINLIMPVILVLAVILPEIQYRVSIDFYIGLFLFIGFLFVIHFWTIKYYLMIRRIDFSNSVASLKKQIKQLEKCKTQKAKVAYLLMPFAVMSIYLIRGESFGKISILSLSVIIVVMLITMFFTFKYSIVEKFKMLNLELDQLEELEKE